MPRLFCMSFFLFICVPAQGRGALIVGRRESSIPRPSDLKRRRPAARPGEDGQRREAVLLSCWIILTHRPRGKRNAAPRHRTPRKGRRQSKTRTQNKAPPEEQTNIHNSLVAHRAAEARKAGSKLPGRTRSGRRTKKDPRPSEKRTQDATPEGPAGRNTQDAPGRVNEYNIFLFFSFSLGDYPYHVRKSRTVSHRHKTTKLSEAPEALYLWAFSAVSAV